MLRRDGLDLVIVFDSRVPYPRLSWACILEGITARSLAWQVWHRGVYLYT